MHDSAVATDRAARRWLLLIHQLPPKPDYLRVKVRRRLKRLGAVAIKQTVYLLPDTEEALEDLHWLREEIESEGGTAVIAETAFLAGLSDEEVDAMLEAEMGVAPESDIPEEDDVEEVEPGRTWVTREGVKVDRIASAWLIRRFIDPDARFKFVAARGYKKRSGELRFDMFEAEYTHVGADCSFQTLSKRFGVTDRAVRALGEIVHDIDCKDQLFDRPETAGIATLIKGIVDAHDADMTRVERGAAMFDDLYASQLNRRSQAGT